ncbi:MATE family efflux transporter [Faecalitalea cylindroides]|uniref:MATE family efflux transporter n=1 Tax=Faecalitalea cylindroides TaxID=39483 RepID=UPI0003370CA7|nr:MATE family efflux transporter [Faecalitalea cylindroides]CDD49002.1 putative efflux protein MATE family [Firmicutes bacterium CAG:308]MDB7951860.1 MATE family efflux transporter [Faecalitalea cylindroides]MDB7958614.1 MATE family efflux transporter [Faecalitalea cylindroides]MDB7960543.1 MATE family efflux transporter [Faecalitalea cylindroides]MDB7962448.1 MATE family efflux transporter [Faecalitalea cylindroides]
MSSKYTMDMCNGPLLKKIILFAIPLMLSGVLQLLFNAADVIVVGRFTGNEALAAVGSTSSLINLLINLFVGVSVGANVLLGKHIGARDEENASKTVHTAVTFALVVGIAMIFVGFFLSRPLLELMGTPEDVINLSVLYMRIYFVGMPAFMFYNFGAALLRAVGDTKRPLYFLTLAGIINVIFNLIFVIVFHMGVAGVALATIISEGISAFLVFLCLKGADGVLHLDHRSLSFHKDVAIQMMKIGLPAGLQGCIFSVSNVLIQSSVNSFGSIAMAGNTASANLEGFVYNAMNSLYQTSLSFTSQNMGAKKYKRVDKILIECLVIVMIVGIVMGGGAYLIGTSLLSIYSSDPQVISYGLLRMSLICVPYFLCGMMDVFVGSLRGMGYSVMPMLVSLTGACLFRIIWIFTIFATNRSLFVLYFSYPVSWALTATAHLICYMIVRKKVFK